MLNTDPKHFWDPKNVGTLYVSKSNAVQAHLGPSEGMRGGSEAPPRLPETRLVWTSLWRMDSWTAGGPVMNIWHNYTREL